MLKKTLFKNTREFLEMNLPSNFFLFKKSNIKLKKYFTLKAKFINLNLMRLKKNLNLKKPHFNVIKHDKHSLNLNSSNNIMNKKPVYQNKFLLSAKTIKSQFEKIQTRNSIFKNKLKEKKKLCILYGNLSHKNLKLVIEQALSLQGSVDMNLLCILEKRLDIILYRALFFPSITAAKQSIRTKKILVNNINVNIPSYKVNSGDIISINEKSKKHIANNIIKYFIHYNLIDVKTTNKEMKLNPEVFFMKNPETNKTKHKDKSHFLKLKMFSFFAFNDYNFISIFYKNIKNLNVKLQTVIFDKLNFNLSSCKRNKKIEKDYYIKDDEINYIYKTINNIKTCVNIKNHINYFNNKSKLNSDVNFRSFYFNVYNLMKSCNLNQPIYVAVFNMKRFLNVKHFFKFKQRYIINNLYFKILLNEVFLNNIFLFRKNIFNVKQIRIMQNIKIKYLENSNVVCDVSKSLQSKITLVETVFSNLKFKLKFKKICKKSDILHLKCKILLMKLNYKIIFEMKKLINSYISKQFNFRNKFMKQILKTIYREINEIKKNDFLFHLKLKKILNLKKQFFNNETFNNDVSKLKINIKPLNLEISYKTFTIIYLYKNQKLVFPCSLDVELLLRYNI